MSGFLRQLASRSVGAAPRLRSAPSPRALELAATVPRDAWPGDAPALRAVQGDSDAHVRIARDDAGFDGLEHTPLGATRIAGNGQVERIIEAAGANGPDASQVARGHHGHVSLQTPFADADMPALDPVRGKQDAQDTLSPDRRSRELRSGDADHDPAEGRQTRPAAMPPITRPYSAAAFEAHEVADGAAPTAPRDSALPTDARTLPERQAHTPRSDAAPRLTAQSPSLPDVHITIDRLEVAPPPQRAAPAAPRSAALSLRAYLTARRAGLP